MPERIPEHIFKNASESDEKLPKPQYFKDANALKEFTKISFENINGDDFSEEERVLATILNDYLSRDAADVPDNFFTPAYFKKNILIPLENIIYTINSEGVAFAREIDEFHNERIQNGEIVIPKEDEGKAKVLEEKVNRFIKRRDYFKGLDVKIKSLYRQGLKNIKSKRVTPEDFPVNLN